MKIVVKAKSNAKKQEVIRISQDSLPFSLGEEIPTYKVSVKELPMQGKANEAIIRALAQYFSIAPSLLELVSGASSKTKVFNINL